MKHLHIIPVPLGASTDEAWEEIKTMGVLVVAGDSVDVSWDTVDCDGEECAGIEWDR